MCAVTYTRAAALELKLRVAETLGLPTDAAALKKNLPWIGTIHSLSFRLAGRPKLVDPDEAYAYLSGKPKKTTYGTGDALFNAWDGDLDEPALALRLASSAKHRLVHPYDALKTLPLAALAQTTPDRLFALVKKYKDWKQETGKVDYEDLLIRGAQHAPPVSALFLDEAQDCSKLLWATLDAWQAGVTLSVAVGDPWQAIHQFSGADPQGFRDRPGKWVSLGVSHRLMPDAVTYAQRVLHRAGWADPLIDSWHGQGKGESTDGGSTAYLARTHRLVGEWEKDLISRGEPFGRLGGKAPLAQASLPAWQALRRIVAGETIPAYQLEPARTYVERVIGSHIAESAGRLFKQLLRDPQAPISADDIQVVTGLSAAYFLEKIPWGSYYKRMEQRHGAAALTTTPAVTLGTIHCSPPDEPILTSNRGYVRMDELTSDDRLVSYLWGLPRGFRTGGYNPRGYAFERTELPYSGPLLTIATNRSRTRVTPNHKVRTYYAPDAEERFVVYLMRKGNWWRIGQTRMRRVDGERVYGLTRRVGNEGADVAWVISVHDTRMESLYQESLLAAVYGIPDANFLAYPGRVRERLSIDDRTRIYNEASPQVSERARALLRDHHLYEEFPFYTRGEGQLRSDKRGFDIHAANLHPKLLVVSAIDADGNLHKEPFRIYRENYTGTVYDITMGKYPYYFSGNLLVHNSAKGLEWDHVRVLRQWGTIPSRALQEAATAKDEACCAFVGVSRHRVSLQLTDLGAFGNGGTYPF